MVHYTAEISNKTIMKIIIPEILTEQQEDPPEPVLTVKVASEVVRELGTQKKAFMTVLVDFKPKYFNEPCIGLNIRRRSL